ncbi:YbaB/EbfC family nucleoid-associated protein [Facklamia sp. DSM 111018]|uniref:Nucleoid-associated protein HZY91_09710 n=1 Tax=Facklamia lactis TaxID=2749967 RepID=A0ABS0LST9_9LACT|nr:YbaB/EbfC family nucleoid-associated protein [Facklamia lactis]MBG9987143.1 YbaB/EbfC family nucleoid-associated protein [Facklamia lactis]
MRGMGNMQNMMKQMQKVQKDMEKAQTELDKTVYTVEDSNQLVKVVINGKKQIQEIEIQEELIDPEDIEMLQDLLLATVNEAIQKVELASQETMGRFTQGLNLPF